GTGVVWGWVADTLLTSAGHVNGTYELFCPVPNRLSAPAQRLSRADSKSSKVQHRLSKRVVIITRSPTRIADAAVNPNVCTRDRKSTRLNSSHVKISYAVF